MLSANTTNQQTAANNRGTEKRVNLTLLSSLSVCRQIGKHIFMMDHKPICVSLKEDVVNVTSLTPALTVEPLVQG